MTSSLELLHRQATISSLDRHFAESMARISGEQQVEVLVATALVSRSVAMGHTCLDLSQSAESLEASLGTALGEDPAAWLETLRASPLVAMPEAGESGAVTPLILDARGRLYLRRYWEHQQSLASNLRERAETLDDSVDIALLSEGLERYFPSDAAPGSGPDRQRLAAGVAVMRRLAVISGGPGTGKTSTVARILALIVEQARARGAPTPLIELVAPTGKAAALLAESIRRSSQQLPCDPDIVRAIPAEARTIHRALGLRGSRAGRARHDARDPLATDLLLVDEASMVDLSLMDRLVAAVPARARLVLIGDEHQLASVEAGAVLGDICDVDEDRARSSTFSLRLQSAGALPEALAAPADPDGPALGDCITRLEHSYRYPAGGGIGALAEAIRRGDAESALQHLHDAEKPEVSMVAPSGGSLVSALREDVLAGYRAAFSEENPEQRLVAYSRYRVLAPHRHAALGIDRLNRQIESWLRDAGWLTRDEAPPGRALLITRNDYELELYNGDIGLVLPEEEGVIRCLFEGIRGATRRIALSRLPEYETAFAMTVHKSQGSEFDRVAVVLPDDAPALLSRELLYTAITRARQSLCIYASAEAIAAAIDRRIERSSGLRDALWDPTG